MAENVSDPNLAAASQAENLSAPDKPEPKLLAPPNSKPAENPKKESSPGILSKLFRRRGRHKKGCTCGNCEWSRINGAAENENPFAAPDLPDDPPPEANRDLFGAQQPGISPPPVGDWSGYGKGAASLIFGIYQLRGQATKKLAEKKLSAAQVDSLFSKLEIPEEIKNDLREGYTELARESGLPAGGGKLAQLVAGHINLELHFQAAIRLLNSELRKMADLKTRTVDVEAKVKPSEPKSETHPPASDPAERAFK